VGRHPTAQTFAVIKSRRRRRRRHRVRWLLLI